MTTCRAVIDATRCPAPAAYRAVIADCANCRDAGFLGCFGHPVCAHAAADLRAQAFHFTQGGPAAVTHIHASTPALEVARGR